jgi:hypothetical protein
MYAFFHIFVRGFSAGLLLKCGSDLRCVGQLAGPGVVAARADRGVGFEEKLIPLQPNWGSEPLGTLMGDGRLPWLRHCRE